MGGNCNEQWINGNDDSNREIDSDVDKYNYSFWSFGELPTDDLLGQGKSQVDSARIAASIELVRWDYKCSKLQYDQQFQWEKYYPYVVLDFSNQWELCF